MERLVAATAAGCVAVYVALGRDARDSVGLARLLRTMGVTLWPLALYSAVDPRDRCSPALALPLAWVGGAWALDTFLMHRGKSAAGHKFATLRLESTSLTALAFGMCGVLRPSEKRHVRLWLLAILGCLTVVLPSHNLEPGSVEEQVFESVQKTALSWCIGFLIAGVALTHSAAD